MKRSEVNAIMAAADEFIRSFGFILPPFAYWSSDEMKARRGEIDGIVGAHLGWDITDYGQDRFDELGLFLFTVRNGVEADLRRGGGMCYAEKIMISRQDQINPMHRHIVKAEDIINRGGATLALKLYESDPEGHIDYRSEVTVATDGVVRRQPAGEVLRLAPGECVTLLQGIGLEFWGAGGDVLIGEVSTVYTVLTDIIYAEPFGRFAEIDEDEPPRHLLVSDYERWFE
jgi:D-lyxose ketol-isomerase